MESVARTSRRVLGIGLAWATLWLGFWLILLGIIGVLDPDSIDPGEGAPGMAAIFGPMGPLSGVVFGVLLQLRNGDRSFDDVPGLPVVGWGMLATAGVQVLYLGHGDAGLAANTKMALLFTVIGGIVTTAWLPIARTWRQGLGGPDAQGIPPLIWRCGSFALAARVLPARAHESAPCGGRRAVCRRRRSRRRTGTTSGSHPRAQPRDDEAGTGQRRQRRNGRRSRRGTAPRWRGRGTGRPWRCWPRCRTRRTSRSGATARTSALSPLGAAATPHRTGRDGRLAAALQPEPPDKPGRCR